MTNFTLKRKLRGMFGKYRNYIHELNQIIDTFEMNGYDYCVIGGFVRDVFLGEVPRDIDIIVDIPSKDLDAIIAHYNPPREKNNFGSYKIHGRHDASGNNVSVDIWTLDNHAPFKIFKKNGMKTGWKQLPDSAWISIDGATWLPGKNKIYVKNLKKTIRKNEINFINYDLFKGPVDNKYIIVSKLIENSSRYNLDLNCFKVMEIYFAKHPNNSSLVKLLHRKNDSISEKEINDYIDFLREVVPRLTKNYELNTIKK